uniref:Uncharacterized protein n=1 Tax=Rhizophora mucronata TaxID=61149 RepID=A0A2P2PP62_RHIMU
MFDQEKSKYNNESKIVNVTE